MPLRHAQSPPGLARSIISLVNVVSPEVDRTYGRSQADENTALLNINTAAGLRPSI